MKKGKGFVIKVNCLVILSLLVFAGTALSRPLAGSSATISFTGMYGTTLGGEFNVHAINAGGFDVDFIGFCLELNETIGPRPYTISSVEDYAEEGGISGQDRFIGGVGQDDLSAASKWVYWEYITGGFGDRSDLLADNVQKTIWALEGETGITVADDPTTTFIESSYSFNSADFMRDSVFYNDHIDPWDIQDSNHFSITGDVYVLNLMEGNDYIQSVIVGEPVPEPATMLLFATGLIGLAGVSYRRKKK